MAATHAAAVTTSLVEYLIEIATTTPRSLLTTWTHLANILGADPATFERLRALIADAHAATMPAAGPRPVALVRRDRRRPARLG